MAAGARLTILMAKAKLRAMGVVPWLLLLGWSAFAASLEPPVLRGSGVRLREPATWTGGALVWILLICTPTGRSPTRSAVRAATNLVLLAKVSLELALVAWLLEFDVAISPGRAAPLVAAGWFLAALMPLALAAAVMPQTLINKILMIASVGPAAAALTALWALPAAIGPLLGATALSLAATVLAMIASRPDTADAFARTHA